MRKSSKTLPVNVFAGRVPSINYRARKKQKSGRIEPVDIWYKYQKQEGLCCWCKKPVELKFDVDHIDCDGENELANIGVSCPRCNRRKGHMSKRRWVGILASEGINHPLNMIYGFPVQMRLPLEDTDTNALPIAA